MPTFKRKKMCSECPFRANAPRGYLGPLTVEDLMKTCHGPTKIGSAYIGDVGELICHEDIGRLADNGLEPDQISKYGQMCVGMVRYVNSLCKSAKNPDIYEFQQQLKQVADKPTIPPFKLEEYHTISFQKPKVDQLRSKK